MELRKEFTFDASHRLPRVPTGHKCGRWHGHTYRVVLVLEGERNQDMGWVVDFADVKDAFVRVNDEWLDHRSLNDIPGLDNPTAENLCWFLFDALEPALPLLSRVEVWETASSMAALSDVEFATRVKDLTFSVNWDFDRDSA